MMIQKLTNVSEVQVVVLLAHGNSVAVMPGQSVTNVDVKNLSEIQQFVTVQRSLSEVPVHEGRTYLKG